MILTDGQNKEPSYLNTDHDGDLKKVKEIFEAVRQFSSLEGQAPFPSPELEEALLETYHKLAGRKPAVTFRDVLAQFPQDFEAQDRNILGLAEKAKHALLLANFEELERIVGQQPNLLS